jgi:hypothetical protein
VRAFVKTSTLTNVDGKRVPPSSNFTPRRSVVAPAKASCGVIRNIVQAMFIVSSKEVSGEVPGLQSVATAIGTPALRSAWIGGSLVSRRK